MLTFINLGVIFAGCTETTFPQDYDYLMDINCRTPFVLTQFFLDFLAQSKGCVINVGCVRGSCPEAGMVAYCMSKAGLEMMSKSSAMELAPLGIRVNCVSPGFTDTNLYRYAGLSEPELDALKQRSQVNIPLQRVANETEVAKSIIFLTTEHARKITGHVMKVDGGKSITTRGQGDWYGWLYMNRKFEQESMKSYANFKMYHKEPEPLRANADEDQVDDWCSDIQ